MHSIRLCDFYFKHIFRKNQKMTGRNYIQRLIDGDNSAMEDIYRSYRGGFLSFARSSLGLQGDDASDLFQDAIICLLQNVNRGKLTELEDKKVKAYLCSTGKYIQANRRRKRTIMLTPLEWEEGFAEWQETEHDSDAEASPQEKEERLQVLYDVVNGIPAPCSKLLDMQFFQRKKQAEIAVTMGYESADSVKTMVNRCKGKVRTIVKQRYRELGYE